MKKIPILILLLILTSCTADKGTINIQDNETEVIGNDNASMAMVEKSEEHTNESNVDMIDAQNGAFEEESEDASQEAQEEVGKTSIYDLKFEPVEYELVQAFPKLKFDKPLFLTGDGSGNKNIYVVEKRGIIWRFPNDSEIERAEIFLDLTDRVASRASEEGLLGLAFHPELGEYPFLYLYYTDDEGTVVSRFELHSKDPLQTDPESELVLLKFEQPYSNHNGGHLAFGSDGYLYIASGDGGSAGDPNNNAQDLQNLLGKILRIDVRDSSEGSPYDIPSGNPFAGNEDGYREEIFAYGLRNPWRFSFDPERNLLLAADVGQDRVEEIDSIISGGNYGWAKFEGSREYKSIELQGDREEIMPVWEYEHPIGKSITGGYTYYGSAIPSLYGAYIYGDFISGRIWALWLDESERPSNVELTDSDLRISSFGLDDFAELYIVDYSGEIYKIVEKQREMN